MLGLIRYKGIEHAVLTDAPFIGARIAAIQCHNNCPGCFNRQLNDEPYIKQEATQIINEIKRNTINEGIIFGGLEWTEQPDELRQLVYLACMENLKIMLYTHLSLQKFLVSFWDFRHIPNFYVKCGGYEKDSKPYYDAKHDVTLASTNQYICKLTDLD